MDNKDIVEKYNWFIGKANIERKQHQLDGIIWCVNNELAAPLPAENPLVQPLPVKGGFICDEMGLGKTIMMIGVCLTNFLPHTLIVVPPMLLAQWNAEIFRTTGHRALIFHGNANKTNITSEQLSAAPIVLTTYNTLVTTKKYKLLRLPPKEFNHSPSTMLRMSTARRTSCLLHSIAWSRVICDEAHHLRNKNSRSTGCKLLKSDIRWLVTGTPIQNSRKDYYNLCSALGLPASMHSKAPILRRTKAQIGIKLPSVSQDNDTIAWSNKNEMQLSSDIHSELDTASFKLHLFLQARKSCILPSMLSSQITNNFVYSDALNYSSKLDHVISVILARKDNGNGKLIFCHFRPEINAIIQRLKAGGMTNVASFDGRDTKGSRQDKLTTKYDALVLQIQAGCEGLNLQANYSEVYFVSPHWNPAVEDQAVARCHRIGQTKPVYVFRFKMANFIKEDVHMLQTTTQCGEQLNYRGDSLRSLNTMDTYITHVQDKKRGFANEVLN